VFNLPVVPVEILRLKGYRWRLTRQSCTAGCDLAKALRSFRSPPVAVGSVSGNMLRKLCSREGIVMGVAAGARGDHFWDGFLWGAATAAHQVEGGSVNSDGSACGAPAARMG
jgi:hypothetical protein